MKKLRKLLYALPVLVALVFAVPPIHTNAADWSTYTVHVTKTGNKYHMAGCSYLSKSDIPINIIQAVNQGYSPCSRCNPPYPVTTYSPTPAVSSTYPYAYTLPITAAGYTFQIPFDVTGNPIQDTTYRGYYSTYAADFNYKYKLGLFENDILNYAFSAPTYDSFTDDEKNVYAYLSDADRLDFTAYMVLDAYNYFFNLVTTYSPVCDPYYFAASYPELTNFCGGDRVLLVSLFTTEGMQKGLQGSPTFNVYTYMNNNPDLVAAYGTDLKSYYTHYIEQGQYEGRIAY